MRKARKKIRKLSYSNKNIYFIQKFNAIDRRILIVLILLVGAVGYYGYSRLISDKTFLPAQERANTYMHSIKDCNYDKHVEVSFNFGLKALSDETKARKDFDEGCKRLQKYSFIKINKLEISDEELAKLREEDEYASNTSYIVDYRIIDNEKDEPYVTRLWVLFIDKEWIVMPFPGYPVPESQYNKSTK